MNSFGTHMIDESGQQQDFAPYFEQHIKPHIDRFEQKRLDAHALFAARKIWVIPACVIVILAAIAAVVMWAAPGDSIGFGVLVCAGLYGYAYWPILQYKGSIKEEIYPLIFQFFGDDFTYSCASAFQLKNAKAFLDQNHHISALKPSGIIPAYGAVNVDDVVTGSYKNVGIEIIEATLKTGGKNKHTIFGGLFIKLTMNKQFKGQTVIQADAGGVGNWLRDKVKKMENVNLEDPQFEKIFEVYSTDQVEARYLLTTSFMERLLELKNLFTGGKGKFQASFYEEKLLLMIPTGDKFKVGSVNQPVSFQHEINTILKEMQLIFQIIDILKLDHKTGI